MNTFLKSRKCPKCGNGNIGNTFCKDWAKWHTGFEKSEHEGKTEVIHRYCRECSFVWSEIPMDKKAKK